MFLGLISQQDSLKSQKEELSLQREDLKLYKDELEKNTIALKSQEDQLKKQIGIMERQQDEETFFKLLSSHQEFCKSLRYKSAGETTATDREYFQIMHKIFIHNHHWESKDLAYTIDKFQHFQQNYSHAFDTYFRIVYQIISWVDTSALEKKFFYISILRAQLTKFELFFIFYNGLSIKGKKLKDLIEKYHFVTYISEEDLVEKEHLQQYEFFAKKYS